MTGLLTFDPLSGSFNMGLVTLFVIALGLSFDSFAVSISCGIIRKALRFTDALVIAFSMAFFQGIMPVAGWFFGLKIRHFIEDLDHWVAFGLLGIIGVKMILGSSRKSRDVRVMNPLKPLVLLSLSVATSIDALIVGISIAFFEIRILIVGFVIGGVTFVISMLGMLFGKRAGIRFGGKIEILGGIILIGIGIKILIDHLLNG